MAEAGYDLLEDIGFLLSRSGGIAVRTANDRMAEVGLRARSFSVLALVVQKDGVSQRWLSELLSLDPSTLVAIVDDLEAQGLIGRRPGSGDRRVRELSATRRGRQRLKAAAKLAAEGQGEFLADLDSSERDVLRTLLRRIAIRNVDEAEAAS
jgi:DNA-binding MarR family transcriptional regulator